MQTNEVHGLLKRVWLNAHFADLLGRAAESPSGAEIVDECLAIADMLVRKNKRYGDSAMNPVRIFSKASPTEQILVRIDDKLSRLSRGNGAEVEDTIGDLLGYLVLLRVAERRVPVESPEVPYSPYLEDPLPLETQEKTYDTYFNQISEAERRWEKAAEPFVAPVSPSNTCQECSESVEENVAVCDVCYRRRFGREKIDLSAVAG
jgi:hypothetical protein